MQNGGPCRNYDQRGCRPPGIAVVHIVSVISVVRGFPSFVIYKFKHFLSTFPRQMFIQSTLQPQVHKHK